MLCYCRRECWSKKRLHQRVAALDPQLRTRDELAALSAHPKATVAEGRIRREASDHAHEHKHSFLSGRDKAALPSRISQSKKDVCAGEVDWDGHPVRGGRTGNGEPHAGRGDVDRVRFQPSTDVV